jgi:arylsulfatase A-like enzyme
MRDKLSFNNDSPSRFVSQSPAQTAFAGVKVAVVGSLMLGICESLAALAVIAGHTEARGWFLKLMVAIAGKAAVTHLLIWVPVMCVLSLCYWLVVRSRHRPFPEVSLAALFVMLGGFVVVPADLQLTNKATPISIIVSLLAVVVVAVVVHKMLGRMCAKIGPARFRRVVNTSALACGVAMAVAGITFARSPIYGPGSFRVVSATGQNPAPPNPHVLWIVLDTARADRMSLYGYERETTPFLKRWASQAVVFDRCFSNGIWTLPSHATMFTGLSVRQHGTDWEHPWLDDEFVTVAELLRDAGYRTASFSNNPCIAHHSNLTQGFEEHYQIDRLSQLTRFSLEYVVRRLGRTPPLPWMDHDFGAALTNYMIADWLQSRRQFDSPIFLFVNYLEPHLPFAVPREFRELFMNDVQVARSYRLRQNAYGEEIVQVARRANLQGTEILSRNDSEVLRRQYEAALRYLDFRVGELLDVFSQQGLLQHSLVIISSDHGEYLNDHGMWAHQFLAYNDVLHVPLLLRQPNRTTASRVSTPVQLSDLYNTVLNETLGSDMSPPAVESRVLLRTVEAHNEGRMVVSEYGGPGQTVKRLAEDHESDAVVLHRFAPQAAVQDACAKLLVSTDGQLELYDTKSDPGELRNLIAALPAEAERLATHLETWLRNTPEYDTGGGIGLDDLEPSVIEALKKLGYVDE